MRKYILMILLVLVTAAFGKAPPKAAAPRKKGLPKAAGREDKELLKCANLIYAGSKSSVCFSEKFLATIARETNCQPQKKFSTVRLAKDDMFKYPFAIMTGEGVFKLLEKERQVLKSYLTRGGFLLASAGCSSKEWDRSFRLEIKKIFPDKKMTKITLSHPIFHSVFDVSAIKLKKGGKTHLEGLVIDGKIVMIYSPEGLNDTGNSGKNCCCCGGNEVKNSQEINVNIFTYALTH
ncbi:MAG: DUF4159 domain-containing protein [Planctomycetes bacterium]|nr:DUF4159 domain-containing protein [Planctomycetota bacterium]